MSTFNPAPVTDAEVRHAVTLLKQFKSGVTRAEPQRSFGNDRRGRLVMAEVASRGIACIVTPEDSLRGKVYKIAQTEEEYLAERRQLQSRIRQLQRRVDGNDTAWLEGVHLPQEGLFEVPA